tara:strand:- start:505 stop:708 length:204 start_codon:yes stop_codon:yes gene_type:complete
MDLTKLKRDEKSNAVLNTDISSLNAYRASRDRDNQINRTINDVDDLKEDVKEIKNMLKALVDGSKRF